VLEDLLVGEIVGPTVGVGDGFIKGAVGAFGLKKISMAIAI